MAVNEEGTTRKPSFYSHGRGVVCVDCADEVIEEGVAVEALQAHYFIGRPMLCGHCHAQLGPWDAEEISPDELVKCLTLYASSGQVPSLEELVEQARVTGDG